MKRNTWRKCLAALLFFCCLFVWGGCSAPEEEAASATPGVQLAVEAGVESVVVQKGGQLLTYIPQGVKSLNPLYSDDNTASQLLSLCYEPLIAYNGNLELSPSLAESWSAEEEGRVWTIQLRQNVQWHDGEPFDAADVVHTISLLKTAEYAGSSYAHHINRITEYTALNEHTLRIVTDQPGQMVLYALTFPVVSAHAFGRGRQPIGTGPYLLSHASTASGLQFDINPNWWKNPPYIERVLAKWMDSDTAAMGSMKDDTLNFLESHSLTAGSFREEGHISIVEIASQQLELLYINSQSKFLSDPDVRIAIAYAINRRDIISKAYLGHAFAVDVPVLPDAWYYDSDSKIYDYNPNRAADLLYEKGWMDMDGDGILDRSRENGGFDHLQLRILVNDTPENTVRKDAAAIIKTNLETIGIGVEIVEETWSNSNESYIKNLKSGNFDLALAGFYLDKSPDLSPFLLRDGEHNYGNYSSTNIENALTTLLATNTNDEMLAASHRMQKAFVEELPFIPLYFRTASLLFHDSLIMNHVSDLREEAPYYSVDSWHFDEEGRALFAATNPWEGESNWTAFDQNWPQSQNTAQTAADNAAQGPQDSAEHSANPTTPSQQPGTEEAVWD